MILTAIDDKIQRAFSNAAVQYDGLTDLHKEIGNKLLKGMEREKIPSTVLDVGMGTGLGSC